MNPAFDFLLNVFKTESAAGFKDTAVIGGLDKIQPTWEKIARENGVDPVIVQAVNDRLRDYARLSPSARADSLRGLWKRIQNTAEPTPAPTAESSPRPPEPEPRVDVPPPQREPDRPPTPSLAPEAPSGAQPAAPAEPSPAVEPPATELEGKTPGEGSRPAPAAPARPPQKERPLPPAPPEAPVGLNAELTVLRGVGPGYARNLERLGIRDLGDMLWYFPRRYDDYSRLKPIYKLEYGEEVTIIGTIWETHVRKIKGGQSSITQAIVSDGTANIQATWFNQPYLAERLKPETQIVLSGRVDQYLGRLTLNSPEWEPLEREQLHTGRIVPVYGLTAGVTNKWLRQRMSDVVNRYANRVPDPLPESIRRSAGLVPLGQALRQIHFPDGWDELAAARHRLSFDELLLLQLGVLRQKREWQSLPGREFRAGDEWLQGFNARLPFGLTDAQQRALAEIRADLASGHPMNRLLQGDVGSGKTVIAAAAMAIAVAGGAQAALMAPTSILAEQHFRSLQSLLAPRSQRSEVGGQKSEVPLLTSDFRPPTSNIRLLLGSTPETEKEEIRAGLADGSVQMVVGTHALIEGPVEFANLGLAVVDEQHRFGVSQRAALRAKGGNPHLLVMTATPIPRSLALTVYGDLDLSVLDELPPGRQPIETRTLTQKERERAYAFVRSQVEKGRQAFFIFPLVEESEKIDAKAAVEEHARLQKGVFPNYRVGLLHGRMRPDEKDEVMARFRDGEYQILVATSVVEVGVDVPNASVMLIEGANRFGLSQLHQFRGRVGRGPHASYCLLISDAPDGQINERLRAMERTSDGFALAQMDLDQRGPGDFLGTRQAGFADLRLAKLTDVRLIEKARREATALFEADPALERPEHAIIRERLAAFWDSGRGDVS